MKFYSLNNNAPAASFNEAVIRGIAPDRGLYFPERIEALHQSFFENIEEYSQHEIAYEAIKQFVEEDIPEQELRKIIKQVLDFPFPLVKLEENIAALELFHGPTMAFKDVGARFMAHCLGYFNRESPEEVTILVATSGDTGGAVANGFLGVEGVKVVILYPEGKVSDIQERQLTTLGQNITTLKVKGNFDDCQEMVKTAFLDSDLISEQKLTSANSINVARWLPQMFYYLFAYQQAKKQDKEIVFSVPSGNFGNICAGMVAQKLGMPCHHFIAATNVNDTVPQYMKTGFYEAKASIATISNAMDVGDPSNFIRIRKLYENDLDELRRNLSAYSFTDLETRNAIAELYHKTEYILDPHGAVGLLGVKKYQENNPHTFGIFLETAHPVKFLDIVEQTLKVKLEIPTQIAQVMDKEKRFKTISRYQDLKEYLLSA